MRPFGKLRTPAREGTDVAPFDAAGDRRTIVTIAALLVRDGRALLVRRHAGHRESPGMWDLPGGYLLDHEDDVDAAVLRVVQEELGVLPQSCEFIDTKYAPLADGEPRVDNLYVVFDWEGEPVAAGGPDHFDGMEWVALDDLINAVAEMVEPRRSLVRLLLGMDRA